MLSELQWDSLESRRKNHRLGLMYKMNTGLAPDYLSNLLPTASQDRYALRNSENTPLIPCKTKLYSDSFILPTIRQWNNLPQPALQTQKHKPPINYNSGARFNQILHCRLRLGCSSLNHDLYKKKITHSPLCTCGQAETQANYLLNCPNHISQRHQYFRNLPCPITVNTLLYVGGPITSRHKCPNCHKLTKLHNFNKKIRFIVGLWVWRAMSSVRVDHMVCAIFDFFFFSYYLHKHLNVKRHIPFLTPYNKHKIHININWYNQFIIIQGCTRFYWICSL